MSKAGKASEGGVTSVGHEHPQPENIPHLSSPVGNGSSNGHSHSGSVSGSVSGSISGGLPGATSGSPVKESSFLQRETSADEPNILGPKSPKSPENRGAPTSPPSERAVPIRWQS